MSDLSSKESKGAFTEIDERVQTHLNTFRENQLILMGKLEDRFMQEFKTFGDK
jgi:hypothetical protein